MRSLTLRAAVPLASLGWMSAPAVADLANLKAPAKCVFEEGRYESLSPDRLRRNQLTVVRTDATVTVEIFGTWRPTLGDDGRGVHAGQITATAPANSCRLVIHGIENSCRVTMDISERRGILIQQHGECLGFGDAVNVSGRYKRAP